MRRLVTCSANLFVIAARHWCTVGISWKMNFSNRQSVYQCKPYRKYLNAIVWSWSCWMASKTFDEQIWLQLWYLRNTNNTNVEMFDWILQVQVVFEVVNNMNKTKYNRSYYLCLFNVSVLTSLFNFFNQSKIDSWSKKFVFSQSQLQFTDLIGFVKTLSLPQRFRQ